MSIIQPKSDPSAPNTQPSAPEAIPGAAPGAKFVETAEDAKLNADGTPKQAAPDAATPATATPDTTKVSQSVPPQRGSRNG